jgi:hypothetical protein
MKFTVKLGKKLVGGVKGVSYISDIFHVYNVKKGERLSRPQLGCQG